MTHWVEFLVRCLKAHADTLKVLSETCGETYVIAALEAGESGLDEVEHRIGAHVQHLLAQLKPDYFQSAFQGSKETSLGFYDLVEEIAQRSGLSLELQPFLWQHPFYRALVESSVPIDVKFKDSESIIADLLYQFCIQGTREWLGVLSQSLPLAPELQSSIVGRWIRCRTQFLRIQGRAPLADLSRSRLRLDTV